MRISIMLLSGFNLETDQLETISHVSISHSQLALGQTAELVERPLNANRSI